MCFGAAEAVKELWEGETEGRSKYGLTRESTPERFNDTAMACGDLNIDLSVTFADIEVGDEVFGMVGIAGGDTPRLDQRAIARKPASLDHAHAAFMPRGGNGRPARSRFPRLGARERPASLQIAQGSNSKRWPPPERHNYIQRLKLF